MEVVRARNVNDAYKMGVALLERHGVTSPSRNGDVLVAPWPVTTVYDHPDERVLFDETRDANPFFHLMESVWMLGGRRDSEFLNFYVRDFKSRYAEPDGHLHGAYGHRWREHFDLVDGAESAVDQLIVVGDMLFSDPTTRRAVLAMWDPISDLAADKKDLPCNTHVYFSSRRDHLDNVNILDMTVCCRSNDIVWGAYGANVVHMSVMHELMAGLSGMRLGIYRQMSNNFHMYLATSKQPDQHISDPYRTRAIVPRPMLQGLTPLTRRAEALTLLQECRVFCAYVMTPVETPEFTTDWLRNTVLPMHLAHASRRSPDEFSRHMRRVSSPDWQNAGLEWRGRRK